MEDEKKSDEIEINVGGVRGQGRRREKRRDRLEQDTKIFTSSASFVCKSMSKMRKKTQNAQERKQEERNMLEGS